jgi:hypothetical protein
MATYTSTQDGNWNTDATWGGGGHPTINDDVAVIGHDVTYDAGESSIVWGSVTINSGGMLVFPSNASSIMSFSGTAVLTVNSGGEVRTGTTSAVGGVDSAYTLTIQWANGTTARNVFVIAEGGTVDIRGDVDYYGDTRYAHLDADWTTGDTLYLQGDMTGKWASGHVFYIFDNANTYANYGFQIQGGTYTISSVGSYDSGNDRTPIVVTAANPTRTCYAVNNSDWRSKLCMVSRNVILKDTGQNSYEVYGYSSYAERIRISLVTTVDCHFEYVCFIGWNTVFHSTTAQTGSSTVGCSAINNDTFVWSSGGHYGNFYDADVISGVNFLYPTTSSGCVYTGYLGSLVTVVQRAAGVQFLNMVVVNCNNFAGSTYAAGFIDLKNVTCVCCNTVFREGVFYGSVEIYNCVAVLGSGASGRLSGVFKGNTDLISAGVKGAVINGDIDSVTSFAASSPSFYSSCVLEDSTISGTDRSPIRIYTNAGNILPLESGDTDWQTPNSANAWILQALPNSYCIFTAPHHQIEYSPSNAMATYAHASSTTLTIKIWPVGWTTSLDQDDVVLEVKYLDTASGITRTTVYNTSQTYANGAWRSCSVTFTPAQAGIVYFNLYFRSYESGAYVLIDPIWSVA